MPNSTINGDDPLHELSKSEKDKLEPELRAQARKDRLNGKNKEAAQKNSRATIISRRPSNKAQHH